MNDASTSSYILIDLMISDLKPDSQGALPRYPTILNSKSSASGGFR
jgi:hypothetical protein